MHLRFSHSVFLSEHIIKQMPSGSRCHHRPNSLRLIPETHIVVPDLHKCAMTQEPPHTGFLKESYVIAGEINLFYENMLHL